MNTRISLTLLLVFLAGCAAPEQQLADHVAELGALYASTERNAPDTISATHEYLGTHLAEMEALSTSLQEDITTAEEPAVRAQEVQDVLAEPVEKTREARRAFQVAAIQNEAVHLRLTQLGRQAVADRATRMRESIAGVMRTIRRTLRPPKGR